MTLTQYQEGMIEIFNLCQHALIWKGMCENSKFNYKLLDEIQKITEGFDFDLD